jgi:hypothetical protein
VSSRNRPVFSCLYGPFEPYKIGREAAFSFNYAPTPRITQFPIKVLMIFIENNNQVSWLYSIALP